MSAVPNPGDDNVRMLAEWHEQIEIRLNRDRPSPLFAGGRCLDGTDDRVCADPSAARRRRGRTLAARKAVVDQESKANRKANHLIKRYAGQGVLFWGDLGPKPFTLDERNGFRVRFDAATPDDFDTKAQLIRESADRRRDAEYVVADWLEECANEARAAGYERVAEIGDRGDPNTQLPDDELDDEGAEF